MKENIFDFRLMTAKESVVDASVHMAIVPGVEGCFGVLKHHMEMMSLTKPGMLELKIDSDLTMRFMVSYGLCRVNDDGCDLVVEDVIRLQDIDKEVVNEKLKACKEELLKTTSTSRKKKLEHRSEFLQLCLDVDKKDK